MLTQQNTDGSKKKKKTLINRSINMHYSWIGKVNIVKIPVLP